jgi:serine/threonine protein kinase
MICPACQSANEDGAEACFTCGMALFAVTQGIVLGGRYEVLRPLGAGGMGRVYKAHDRVLGEDVAVKILRPEFTRDPEMTRRFRSEIRLARKVSHRNVCRIFEYGEDDALCFISMEYIEGRTVKEHLEVHPPDLHEAYSLALQVAQGLKAVHEHGIIHRDFKASNVMIDGEGVVKLMDFGIAKETGVDTSGHTGSGVLGTPEYMSPEQGGGGKVDFRSDVYSLGCVVFELFTGRPPFRGDTPLATLYKHQREPPPLEGARVPDALIPVLRVALAKAPADRFASVGDFIEALRKARAASPGGRDAARDPETATIPNVAHASREAGRIAKTDRLWPWALLTAGTVAAVVAVGVLRPVASPEATPSPQSSGIEAPQPQRVSPLPVPPGPPAEETDASRLRSPPTTRPSSAPTTLSKPVSVPSATPPPLGNLTLLVVPEAEVTVDGTPLGRVSLRELRLPEGLHTIRVLHPDYEPLQRKVTLLSGVSSKLVLDLAEKGIRKAP